MRQTNSGPRRPCRLLIQAVRLFSLRTYQKRYGLTIDRSALDGVKPPYIVLFNHVGDDDHVVVGMTLYPQLANYMVARWVQHSFPAGPLSVLAGAIHKNRFTPDVEAVVNARRAIRNGGVVAIAPAASFSVDGTPSYFDYGIAKLIKNFRVPVYAVRMSGLYMFHNHFNREKLDCRLESTVKKVFDADETAAMSVEDIYKRAYDACDFNVFQYQRRVNARITAHRYGLADGMELVAYTCLKCGAEFATESDGDVLRCTKCGNAVRVNDRFFFEPVAPGTAYVESLDRWNAIQRRRIEREIDAGGFSVSAPCTLAHYTVGKRYGFSDYGRGVLTLDESGLTYTGTDMGQDVAYAFPLERTPYLGNFARYYLSIDQKDDVYRFCLDDMRMGGKFLNALRILRMTKTPMFPNEYAWYLSHPTVNVDTEIRISD